MCRRELAKRAPPQDAANMVERNRYTPWDLNSVLSEPIGMDETAVQTYAPHGDGDEDNPITYHVITPVGLARTATLQQHLESHTDLSACRIKELTQLGAVYVRASEYNVRTSPRPIRQTAEQLQCHLPARTPIYVRVYARPKRHAAVTSFAVLSRTDLYVAVCKPGGIPAVPTRDNAVENLLRMTEERVNVRANSLCITTRLDSCTTGVSLMTWAEHSGEINAFLKQCEKRYLVWTRKSVREGVMLDWYYKRARLAAGALETALLRRYDGETEGGEGFALVKLVVESCESIEGGFVSRVRLVTGKTHQIRLQFAARGAVVNGDAKYDGMEGRIYGGVGVLGQDAKVIGLHAAEIRGRLRGEEVHIAADWRMRGDDPSCLDVECASQVATGVGAGTAGGFVS
ncbi:putative RNA pseudouridine synthase [Gracilariopsis chorda]|uniref:Putative RNA pseudouridine synthase n=1 Tax=Gracilariopsis chorda TaxID=448386 RepID=A0A2V3IZ42_9FLOR|nr:putative RNA pseudouridine synthase [Gracilariopsis chorda]|eukprot:PXF47418.1 putative RNA pseudouridine synthase [Gracilariopsis chorda]